ALGGGSEGKSLAVRAESKAGERSRLRRNLAGLLPRLDVPDLEDALLPNRGGVLATDRQALAVGAEADAVQLILNVRRERECVLAGADVPQHQLAPVHVVRANGGQVLAVRTEGEVVHDEGASGQGLD